MNILINLFIILSVLFIFYDNIYEPYYDNDCVEECNNTENCNKIVIKSLYKKIGSMCHISK